MAKVKQAKKSAETVRRLLTVEIVGGPFDGMRLPLEVECTGETRMRVLPRRYVTEIRELVTS